MKLNFTDMNGKQISTSLSEITDMTAYINDEQDDKKTPNFRISVKDAEGKEMDIAKIADAVKKDPGECPAAIDVTYESTHSGSNRNSVIYHSDSMKKDAKSWMEPFARPMLKNHDIESEPMGRVVDFKFKQSALNPERDCIEVTWRITDQDAIPKFLDGRYHTLSIGASGKHINCNLCGKDILKDGIVTFCGHWKGEVYPTGKDKTTKCLWNVRDMEYREGSVVNSPADDWAQQTNVKVVEDSQSDGGEGGKQMDQLNDKSKKDKDPISTVDDLLNDHGQEANKDTDGKDKPGADNKDSSGEETPDKNNEDQGDDAGDGDDNDEGSDKELQAVAAERDQLKVDNEALRKDNEALTNEVNSLKDKVKELESQLATSKTSEDSLKEELKLADDEAKANRKQGIQMALMNKELLAARVVDYKIFINEAKAEDRETLVAELKTKSAKDLNDTLTELLTKKVQRKQAEVNNPGANNPKDKHVVDESSDSGDNNNKDSNVKEPTLADLTETCIDALTSNKNGLQK